MEPEKSPVGITARPVPVFEDHVKTRESGDQEQVYQATTAGGSR